MYEHVFDEIFYRETNGLGAEATLAHFIAWGDGAGLDPGPYFSTSYYKSRYPDWAARGARSAVEDFVSRLDAGEARQPHPLIDPEYYTSRYPDLSVLGSRAVLHFFIHGDCEVRSPSAAFDADFYQRCYLALEEPFPFRHFIREGRSRGNLPAAQRRSQELSRIGAERKLSGMTRPLLFCGNDARPAGVPILSLDLARSAIARGWQPLFVLQWGGPLVDGFRELGPVVLLAEGWDLNGIAAAFAARSPVLVNSAAAAAMAVVLSRAGHRCLVLVHEMAGYLRSQNLLPILVDARDAGAELVASIPRMAMALEPELGPMARIGAGIIQPSTSLAAFRQARRAIANAGNTVFIGAGHADHRKGFDLFLEAAAIIASKNPGARFVWLGALDGWARRLADGAIADGLDLHLPGFVADALAWYRAADVYLLTSREDAGPTTLTHAAAVGTPFVGYAADIGLIGVIDDLGTFVPPGDAAGFADAAIRAAAQVSPASRRRLRRWIRREGDFERYVDALLARVTTHPAGD